MRRSGWRPWRPRSARRWSRRPAPVDHLHLGGAWRRERAWKVAVFGDRSAQLLRSRSSGRVRGLPWHLARNLQIRSGGVGNGPGPSPSPLRMQLKPGGPVRGLIRTPIPPRLSNYGVIILERVPGGLVRKPHFPLCGTGESGLAAQCRPRAFLSRSPAFPSAATGRESANAGNSYPRLPPRRGNHEGVVRCLRRPRPSSIRRWPRSVR